jgi:hypothetical protein
LIPTFSWAALWSDLSFNVDTFSTTTYVQPLLIDPSGMRTGLLGFGGSQVNEIPNSNYSVDATEDLDNGTPGIQGAEVGVGPIAPGQYTLIIWGGATTPYEVSIRASHTDQSLSIATSQGFAVQNSSREYTVNIDPAPGGQFTVVKTVNFQTLLQELQVAFEVGQIGDKKFVAGLEDLLAQGQKALERKDDGDHRHDRDDAHGKREAIEILRQFIDRIDSASKEKTDRDHDRDGARFASSAAAQSLTSDAKTLIQKIGGKPEGDRDGHDGRPGKEHDDSRGEQDHPH